MTETLATRLHAVEARIQAAVARREHAGGPAVRLIGVSKRQHLDKLLAAHDAGLRDFGENYAQELRDKQQRWQQDRPRDRSCRWHYIGALQSNKLKYLVGKVDLIHTVDRLELIAAIDRRAAALDRVQEILLEVAIAGETQKAGAPVDALPGLLRACARTTHLRCVGLMIIPPDEDEPEAARRWFRLLREHRDRLREELADLPPDRVGLEHLSMGMSADYEQAIEEGATLVRVGTAIFGPREG